MAKTKDQELLHFIHAQHHAYFSLFANRDMLLESFRASVGGKVRQVAARLKLPVLLVAGAKDEIAPLADQHKLLPLLPDGRADGDSRRRAPDPLRNPAGRSRGNHRLSG